MGYDVETGCRCPKVVQNEECLKVGKVAPNVPPENWLERYLDDLCLFCGRPFLILRAMEEKKDV